MALQNSPKKLRFLRFVVALSVFIVFRRLSEYKPIELASRVQRYWLPFTNLCHGLLGGLGLAHLVYLRSNYYSPADEYLVHYSAFSDIYVCLFYFLCVICLISVYDRWVCEIKGVFDRSAQQMLPL